jgi:hypothetical protein
VEVNNKICPNMPQLAVDAVDAVNNRYSPLSLH